MSKRADMTGGTARVLVRQLNPINDPASAKARIENARSPKRGEVREMTKDLPVQMLSRLTGGFKYNYKDCCTTIGFSITLTEGCGKAFGLKQE